MANRKKIKDITRTKYPEFKAVVPGGWKMEHGKFYRCKDDGAVVLAVKMPTDGEVVRNYMEWPRQRWVVPVWQDPESVKTFGDVGVGDTIYNLVRPQDEDGEAITEWPAPGTIIYFYSWGNAVQWLVMEELPLVRVGHYPAVFVSCPQSSIFEGCEGALCRGANTANAELWEEMP
jgi:hypothetical protein